MIEKWHKAKPLTFGFAFLFIFFGIQILDSKYIYPRLKPVCNGELTEQQIRACSDWIHKKETRHVRTNK